MDFVLHLLGTGFVRVVHALPLSWVARLGRWGGSLAWCLDGRHRRVTIANLERCFGAELDAARIRALARENFRRLGENYACAVKTAGLNDEALRPHLQVAGFEKLRGHGRPGQAPNCVVAIGHFGNFELYARVGSFAPGWTAATTYRSTGTAAFDRIILALRERSRCRFFERRSEGEALKATMTRGGILLGLLCDQHGGSRGLRLPFLGTECSTSSAPAVFALRYQCALHTAVCYRTAPGHWRIELGDEIPTTADGCRRSPTAIMADVNAAFEVAIRRDPANWFWVHRRWKSLPRTAGEGAFRPKAKAASTATAG